VKAVADDDDWLALEDRGDGWFSFELAESLSRFDRRLYGGTAVAVSVAAMERATGRVCAWLTVQFAENCKTGARLDVHTEVLGAGRVVSQLRVTSYEAGRVVWSALGACSTERASPVEGGFATMPAVLEPDACSELRFVGRDAAGGFSSRGWRATMDMREALLPDGTSSGVPMLAWARLLDRPMTRAGLGMVADIVPVVVARAAGRAGAGTSLDNTLRFGPAPDSEWVLVELEPHLAHGGWGHGGARVWSLSGTLVAVASQTARMLVFE
jgi:acyl-CoA thioesterase